MSKKKKQNRPQWNTEITQMVIGGFLVFFGVFLLANDQNSVFGKMVFQTMSDLFGEHHRYYLDPMFLFIGIGILFKKLSWNFARFLGILLYSGSITSLYVFFLDSNSSPFFDFSGILIELFGSITSGVFLIVLLGLSLFLCLRINYRQILSRVTERVPLFVSSVSSSVSSGVNSVKKEIQEVQSHQVIKKKTQELDAKLAALRIEKNESERIPEKLQPQKIVPVQKIPIFSSGQTKKEHLDTTESVNGKPDFGNWNFPGLELLHKITHTQGVSPAEIEKKSLEIQRTLLQFKIEVEMRGQKVGPTVVQYRLDPADGVKLSKIESLKKDLSLALSAKSLRIQAPIPGLALVGIEVPNDKRDIVGIREVLEHPHFQNHPSNLALAIGKDINGEYVVGDLAKMPHLLIAGQTGSGKSVGMNGFLLSLLYKNTPSQLRMILVDPKRVELGIYNGIPHLLTPVINDPDKALNALKWSVAEMLKRYDILQKANTRNLSEFNAKVAKSERFPNIVIVIDELADLMMSGNKKEVESAIARIAQMARAVGMHLIVATQRPSVDVITGLIKANIPSRIAFTVASQIDSRTILDRGGAEDLLGRGDLLYFPTGASSSERVQGVLVETDEVERVVNHIRRTIDPQMLEDIYDASIVQGDRGNFEGGVAGGVDFDEDPKVIEEAIQVVRSLGKGSTSVLQRKLKLGYARAARVMDILEEMGIVGPADGSKPRDVL